MLIQIKIKIIMMGYMQQYLVKLGEIKEGRKWRAEYKSDFEVKFEKKK